VVREFTFRARADEVVVWVVLEEVIETLPVDASPTVFAIPAIVRTPAEVILFDEL
jgi:hypothetical protein